MDRNKDGQIADYMEQMISITAEVFHVKRSDVIRALRERLNIHVNADGIKRLLGLKKSLDEELSTGARKTQQRRFKWLSQLHYLQRWRRGADIPMPSPAETSRLLDDLIRELRSLTRL